MAVAVREGMVVHVSVGVAVFATSRTAPAGLIVAVAVAVGVCVGVLVGVNVDVTVRVGVAGSVPVGVCVTVAVHEAVGVTVAVAVAVGVIVGDGVMVFATTRTAPAGVLVGVAVAVRVAVAVNVAVAVRVAVAVDIGPRVGVGVAAATHRISCTSAGVSMCSVTTSLRAVRVQFPMRLRNHVSPVRLTLLTFVNPMFAHCADETPVTSMFAARISSVSV